ncbi:hypothetical protein CPB83DRAFT_905790 [Crepidotus variabilis]|uniref:Uncharacterized protein n=1 Tax=Crepidotus variabilis TaxID=179855 RepID=A0A9P6EHC5_9AGAR|nr:hypothetical protein CPB83DRAFT_905790 [Crepidotus variabilis]
MVNRGMLALSLFLQGISIYLATMKLAMIIALTIYVSTSLTSALPAINMEESPSNIVVSTIKQSNVTISKLTVPSITTPNSLFKALILHLADSIIICTAVNCAGTCDAYALSGLKTNTCYTPQLSYESAYLFISSGSTPPYQAFASTSATNKCANPYLLPINKCSALPARAFDFFLA